jgi:2,3-bisphosphoglycerate-independent phosphoglycerate mutase
MNKKVILMILDGWGKSPDPKVSAIDNANTPFIDSLYTKYPNEPRRWKNRIPRFSQTKFSG